MKHKKDNQLHKMKIDQKFFALACVLCVIAFLVLLASLMTRSPRQLPIAQNGVAQGTTIHQGDVAIGVKSSELRVGTERFQAATGKQFLIVEISVTNSSQQPISVLPSIDSYVKSSDGTVISLTPYELENPFRAGRLLPGETINGQLSYLVDDATIYALYFDSDWTGGVLKFALQSTQDNKGMAS